MRRLGDKPKAVQPPLRRQRRHLEPRRHLRRIRKRDPRLAHRGLRHEELGAEDVRLALEVAVGVLGDVARAAVGRRLLPHVLLRVADPVAELVGDREAVAAGRGVAVRRLRRVDDDQPLRGDEHPGAVAEVALLDPQAEQVLGDRLDRHGDLVRGEGYEVLRPELVRAGVGIAGRSGRQRFIREAIKSASILAQSDSARTGLTARSELASC